ncbi:hypothetical protein HYX16_05345 [Candidatus Woesearchaeota archaeon]|nr:hypothetical protein [Candidatus Woesearchaeota archaeon]
MKNYQKYGLGALSALSIAAGSYMLGSSRNLPTEERATIETVEISGYKVIKATDKEGVVYTFVDEKDNMVKSVRGGKNPFKLVTEEEFTSDLEKKTTKYFEVSGKGRVSVSSEVPANFKVKK